MQKKRKKKERPIGIKAQTQTFIVPSAKLLLTMSTASWLDINSHTPSEASTINLSPACSAKSRGDFEFQGGTSKTSYGSRTTSRVSVVAYWC